MPVTINLNLNGAVSTILSANLTANRAVISNASGKIDVSIVTSTELGYLSGVTSAIQTQLDGKVNDTGDTMSGNLLFSGGMGIDTTGTGGLDTLNIGAVNAEVINIGTGPTAKIINVGSSATLLDQINIYGSIMSQNVTNLNVTDKLILVNDGGAAASGFSSGFEIEEGGSATGYFMTDATRTGFVMKAPATFETTFLQSSLTGNKTLTIPDVNGVIMTTNGGQTVTSGTWNGSVIGVAYGGTNSSTALNNNRFIISSGGAIVEASAISANRVIYADANGLPTGSANLTFDGTVLNLGAATATGRVFDFKQDTAFGAIGSLVGSTANAAIYLVQSSPSATNYTLSSNGSGGTNLNSSSGATGVRILTAGTVRVMISSTAISFTPGQSTSGAVTAFSFTANSNITQTASTEINGAIFTLGARQWNTGAITTQREFLISAPTYTFVAASTISDAATLAITAAPIAGANCTITRSHALWVQAGVARFDGGIKFSGSGTTFSDTNLISGTYTPTRSAEANITGTVTMSEAQYMRVGNTVTVSGRFTAGPTLTATMTSFEITLPITSNIGATEDVAGVAFCGNIAAQGGEVVGVIANDTAKIQWISADITSQTWSYVLTYQII